MWVSFQNREKNVVEAIWGIFFSGHTTSEMDTMLAKQNKLITKLKGECKRQAAQIETILKKHRWVRGFGWWVEAGKRTGW